MENRNEELKCFYNNNKNNTTIFENDIDHDIIKRLIELNTFCIVPADKCFYTIGLWYYYGLPEIVVELSNDFDEKDLNVHLVVQTLINIIHNKLTKLYGTNLTKEYTANIIDIEHITLTKVKEEHYLQNNIAYMLWFYMYFVLADMKDNEIQMYPLYKIVLDDDLYFQLCLITDNEND
jgi:hypothetical protein